MLSWLEQITALTLKFNNHLNERNIPFNEQQCQALTHFVKKDLQACNGTIYT
jgi:hypothetical protein